MLKIRFARIGRKNNPAFRVVVIEHTQGPKTGKHIEVLGSYNPKTKELVLSGDRVKYWMSVGAQASPTVHNLLIKEGIIEGKKINVLPRKSPIVKEVSGEEEVSSMPEQTETPEETPEEGEVSEEKEEKEVATPQG